MNTSKTLLAILVEELPKRGGWPDKTNVITQDSDGEVNTYNDAKNLRVNEFGTWCYTGDFYGFILPHLRGSCVASDCATAIITRDQYEAALAASQAPAADADGWIEWHGGECPVDYGTIVDAKDRDGFTHFGEMVGVSNNIDDIFWQRGACGSSCNEIVAYRLHQPQDINSRAKDDRLEQDLNDCIGQAAQQRQDSQADVLTMIATMQDAAVEISLNDAFELAETLVDAGYRKQ